MLTTALTSAGPADSLPVDSSPVIVGPNTRVVAASSDSESQEGETDPPVNRKTRWYIPFWYYVSDRVIEIVFGVVDVRDIETQGPSNICVTPSKRAKKVVIAPPSPPPLMHASTGWQSKFCYCYYFFLHTLN